MKLAIYKNKLVAFGITPGPVILPLYMQIYMMIKSTRGGIWFYQWILTDTQIKIGPMERRGAEALIQYSEKYYQAKIVYVSCNFIELISEIQMVL